VACRTCTDTNCDNFIETDDRIRITFESVTLDGTSEVTISSDSSVNGAESVTMKYDIVIGNPLTALGLVYLTMPK
jgi:hypothetical protein